MLQVLDWLSLGFALLPMLIALSNFRLLRPPPVVTAASAVPAVSVLIPARNEADHIGAAVSAVLASVGCDIELLVLDDHSTDATPSILAAFGTRACA